MLIRSENRDDFAEIHELIKRAFSVADHTDGDEQNFAARRRESPGYIPELALVAEENGTLVGHVMLTRIFIDGVNSRTEALLLAPLAVLPTFHRRGIAAALVERAFEIAREMGFGSLFLVGASAYYGRFGFEKASRFSVRYDDDIPEEYVLGVELSKGALSSVSGTIAAVI